MIGVLRPLRCAAASFLVALGSAGTAAADASLPKAVATIGMIADVAENVAGPCVEVTALMGPGVDPHLYQASAGDVRTFQEADAILFSGYSLEGQLGEVLAKLGRTKPVVAVSPASIDPSALITVQDVYGIDPHLWMDAGLWRQIAPTIAETFGEIAPACASDMKGRAERYMAELEALDAWVRASVRTIPEGQRVLVTAHDAFNYYGRAYGIEVAGIQGISTESEAGVSDIRSMVDVVVERGVPAVFIESTINPRTVQAVVDAATERGQEIEIGGELYSDAMGAPGTPGGTYIGMLVENTRTITLALGGEPPALPAELRGWAEAVGIDASAG